MVVLTNRVLGAVAFLLGLVLGYLSWGENPDVILGNIGFQVALVLVVYGFAVGLQLVKSLYEAGWLLVILGVLLLVLGFLVLHSILWFGVLVGIFGLLIVFVLDKGGEVATGK